MRDLLKSISDYLPEVDPGAQQIEHRPDQGRNLPVFLSQMYDLYASVLFGREHALLLLKGDSQPAAAQAEKHVERARAALGCDVVLVLPSLQAFERKRLVDKGIPFIVPHKQVYLPMALVDFREKGRNGPKARKRESGQLSAPAQVAVLMYIQQPATAEWSLAEWAEALQYSRMTLSRVRRELEELGLCEAAKRKRAIPLGFPRNRHALWDKALPMLRSPSRGLSHVRIRKADAVQLVTAGLSALADRTLISAPSHPVAAMSSVAFQSAVDERRVEVLPRPAEDSLDIEKWRYNPKLLCGDKGVADPLSLYLSLRDDPNERVQQALEELLEDVKWQ